MARIRCIKPEFWVSEQIAECSTNARLTFVGLWNFCDDQGVHPAKPKTLKAELYPMDDVSSADVAGWVNELITVGLIAEFESDGERYWHVTGWEKHQKIDRPSFKYPSPTSQDSTTPRRTDSTSTRRAPPPGRDRKGRDRKGVDGDSANPSAEPTPATNAGQPEQSGGEALTAKSAKSTKAQKTGIPPDFAISDRVRTWATTKGFSGLDRHLEAFRSKARAKGYAYVDWDEAFMGAIREDWAGLRGGQRSGTAAASGSAADALAPWALKAGFPNRFEAENAGCFERNAHLFHDGQRLETT